MKTKKQDKKAKKRLTKKQKEFIKLCEKVQGGLKIYFEKGLIKHPVRQ